MNTRIAQFGLAAFSAMFVLGAGAAAPAFAQHALDRNLQHGSGGLNPQGPDIAREMRFRNAVVTGNAPGGLSFRGDVGYRAPGEFVGRVAGDDTFSFRRDTLYSGLGGMGIRGTDAVQYQFARTTGMTPPPGLLMPSGVPRTPGATAGLLRADPIDLRAEGMLESIPPRWSPGDAAADVGGLALSPLRAPSAFVTTRTFQPAVIGYAPGVDGVPISVTADVLRGISYGSVVTGREPRRTEVPPTPAEVAGLRMPLPDDRMERRLDLAATAPQRTPYHEVIERMRDIEAPERDPTAIARRPGEPAVRDGRLATDWRDRLSELRMQLLEPTRADPGRIAERIDPRLDPRTPPEEREAQRREEDMREFSPETIEMLRRAGRIDVLVPPELDVYGAHMDAGQRHLARGRYFDAEERFTAALSERPGDPMAAVGRVHAAIGAGMFLSAAINLRDLLLANPELAAVRYGEEALPRPERLEDVKTRLMDLIETRPDQARDMGLLLAYVGYQTRDEQAMGRGLTAMEAAPEEEPPLRADEQMMRLAALLREVWEE